MNRILLFQACLALTLFGGNAFAQSVTTEQRLLAGLRLSIVSFGFDAATSDLAEADVKEGLRVIEGGDLQDNLTLGDLQPKQKLTLNLEWRYFDPEIKWPGVTREKFVLVSQFDVTDTGEGSKLVTKKSQVDNIGGGEVTYTFITPETDQDKYTFYLLRQGFYSQIKAANSGQKPTVHVIKSYLAENYASDADYRVAYLTLKAAVPAAEVKVDPPTSTCEVVNSLAQNRVDFGGKTRKATVAYIVNDCPEVTIFQKKFTTKDSAPVWKRKTSKKNSSIISTSQTVNKDVRKLIYCAAPKGTSLGSDGEGCLAGSLRTVWIPIYDVPETKILTVEVNYDEPGVTDGGMDTANVIVDSSNNDKVRGWCERSDTFSRYSIEELDHLVRTSYKCQVNKGESRILSVVPERPNGVPGYTLRKSSCRGGSLSNDGLTCSLTLSSNRSFKVYLTPDTELSAYIRALFVNIIGDSSPSKSDMDAKLALVQECGVENLRLLVKSFYLFDESGSVVAPPFATPEEFVRSLYQGVLDREAVDAQVNIYADIIKRGEKTSQEMLEYFVTDTEYHEFIDLANRRCSPPA